MSSQSIALCVSCLRVRHFESYEAACKSNCECGATGSAVSSSAYCPCPACASIAKKLLAAENSPEALRTVFAGEEFEGGPVGEFSYSAAGGLVTAK